MSDERFYIGQLSPAALRDKAAQGKNFSLIRSDDGRTPLHWAVEDGEVNKIKALVAVGVDPNARDLHGNAPLHTAVNIGLTDAISELIEGKANPNARDKIGRTPLHIAVKNDRMPAPLLAALLKGGANPKVLDRECKTPWERGEGNVALEGREEYWQLNDAHWQLKDTCFECEPEGAQGSIEDDG